MEEEVRQSGVAEKNEISIGWEVASLQEEKQGSQALLCFLGSDY